MTNEKKVIYANAWYTPQWIADSGILSGLGYDGIYYAITRKQKDGGRRIQRTDAQRLIATNFGRNKIARYRVKGSDLFEYMKKFNFDLPKLEELEESKIIDSSDIKG